MVEEELPKKIDQKPKNVTHWEEIGKYEDRSSE
jgi:hypothetical protein